MTTRRNVLTLLPALLVGGLGATGALAQERVKVVATFSILGDFARQVGGDRIELATLVGPDGDGHVYSPTPADGRRLAEAKVVLVNGLGFEGWISRLVRSSGTKAAVVEATRGIQPLAAGGGHHHGHSHGHSHGSGADPHAWQSVANAKVYVANVRDALVQADPAGREGYEARAAEYLKSLDALDAEIRAVVEGIPKERRRVITSHDAFRYFGQAYGLALVAPQGVSTEAEASAKDVGRIIQQIRREKAPAVFIESVTDPRLVERIAKETGAKVGPRVYSDALSGPDGPAATYIDMMRHNIRAFSQALSG